jgi:hypothetical protein
MGVVYPSSAYSSADGTWLCEHSRRGEASRGTRPHLARAAPTPVQTTVPWPARAAAFYLALRPALRFCIPIPPLAPTFRRDQSALVSPWIVQGNDTKARCECASAAAHSMLTPRPERRRSAAHGSCLDGTKIAAIERCLVGRIEQKQLVTNERPARLPTCQRTPATVDLQRSGNGHTVNVDDAVADTDAHTIRSPNLLQQRYGQWQIATRLSPPVLTNRQRSKAQKRNRHVRTCLTPK